ncbi:MAG: hypothetical protein RLZZ126_764 [Pseudomonadota bacterium]|jgi:uncharacterized protein
MNKLMHNLRYVLYLIVFIHFSSSKAGSYEDFFVAIKQDNESVVRELLQRGFDVNSRDPNGQHPLFLAIRDKSEKSATVLLGWPQLDPDARNQADESPLMLAALRGDLSLAKRLVELGADVNKTGWTPLHYASTNGHLEIMRLLLEHHAYIDASSPNDTTPLMMAAHYGSASAVKLLLEAGADPGIKNMLGLSAIDFAQRANRKEAADLIAAFIRGRSAPGRW